MPIILAALRYDSYANGPPPVYHVRMLQRHALVYVTSLVYGWKSAQRRMLNIIQGRLFDEIIVPFDLHG